MIKLIKSVLKRLGLREVALKALRFRARLMPETTCRRDGIKYRLDLNELIDYSIYHGGWEPETITFLVQNIKPGDVVIEVGANVGAHTLTIATLVGEKGAVHAFEPTQFARQKLQRNIQLNPRLSSIIAVHEELVTNKSHDTPLKDINSSWRLDDKRRKPETVEAKATTIDEFTKTRGLERLSLLKIDVDGYDYKVIQGAFDTIKKFRPAIFIELCEYTLQAQGDSLADVFSYLADLGYRGFYDDGKRIKSTDEVKNIVGMTTSINGIFRPT